MGIAERKERERREMMTLILNAAMQLYMEKGAANVSIRRIADRIEYSPATIYLYYRNRDDIFYALQNEAFAKFYEALVSVPVADDPLQHLRAGLDVYISFAVDNPELYDIMFIMNAPMRNRKFEDPAHMASRSFGVLYRMVERCLEQKCLRPDDVTNLSFTLWAHIHGMASLLIRNRLDIFPEEVQTSIISTSLDTLIRNFSTEP